MDIDINDDVFKQHDLEPRTFQTILNTLVSIIAVFSSRKDIKYYEPIIRASLVNLNVHPDTLHWLAYTYYKKDEVPKLERVIGEQIIGNRLTGFVGNISSFVTGTTGLEKVDSSKVAEFENKLTMLHRAKIRFTNLLMKLIKNKNINENANLLLHASLINYYLHPKTLDYVMENDFKDIEKPTIIRHNIQKNIFKILFMFAILGVAFYYYGKKNGKKKSKRSKKRSFGTKRKSRKSKKSRKSRKSRS